MTSIDELLRALSPADGDRRETDALAAVRTALEREIAAAARHPQRAHRVRWPRSLAAARQVIPVALACGVALAIGAIVLLSAGGSGAGRDSLTGPAAGPGANALIARLDVLRRPQATGDRLPADLQIDGRPRLSQTDRRQYGAIVPSLTRLVAAPPHARIYLVVTVPAANPHAIWTPASGDQIGIVALTSHGATETMGYPAADLEDATQATEVIPPLPIHSTGGTIPHGGYRVAIVPDGVAHVRWTFSTTSGRHRRTATSQVSDNVAVTPYATAAGTLRDVTWLTPDGTAVPTTDRPLKQAIAALNARLRRTEIRQAQRAHVTVPARLLKAFAVFSYDSPAGTRTADGYTISHPPLDRLPLAVLRGGGPYPVDMRQVRQVRSPSGQEMWVVPGSRGLCVDEKIDPPLRQAFGMPAGGGVGVTCSADIAHALSAGAGAGVGTAHGTVSYDVLPRAADSITVRTPGHGPRQIHPGAGVYIGSGVLHVG